MSLEGFTKVEVKKIGGLVTNFASETVPNGVSPDCRNVRFTLNSVAVRYGVQPAIATGKKVAVNSLGILIRSGLTPSQFPIMFNDDGSLCFEPAPLAGGFPSASGTTQDLTPTLFNWTAHTRLGMAAGFQRMYMVNGDKKIGIGTPGVTDGTNVDPLSQRPYGELWAANTFYNVGECITPLPSNGHTYRCIRAGMSGAVQPVFPTADSATITEGPTAPQLQWQEYTLVGSNVVPTPAQPTVNKVAGAGTFPVSRDVYILVTLVNGQGETDGSAIFISINTTLNDRFVVTAPTLAAWVAALAGGFAVTGYNVYEADVPTGNAAPILSAFHKVNGAVVALNVNTNVDAAAVGVAPPGVNTARIVLVGTVAAGKRFASVIFVNRNQNLSGFTLQSVINFTVDISLFSLFMANIPVGTANCVQRIVVLGAALTSAAGPFFFIDTIQANANNKTFVINDNVTTTATLNFNDDFLGAATDCTNNLRKVKLPPQADIRYLESIRRFVVCGEPGQPSLSRYSNPDDPESFYGDTGFKYIARDNGQRLVTHREYNSSVIIAFKEQSAFSLTTDNTDPINWPAPALWKGSGPAGPDAVDSQQNILTYAHKSGVYLYQGSGEPEWISMEIQDLWEKINWDFGHLICVAIDVEQKEVHFFVPFGGSTVNNVELCVNYARGWDAPVHYSSFSGKEVALPTGRKWSINDIACSQAVRANRRVVVGEKVYQTNFLVASPFPDDSGVLMITPGAYNDGGKGYDARYPIATVGEGASVFKFGGVSLSASGQGLIKMSAIPYHGPNRPLKPIPMKADENRWYTRKGPGWNSRQWGFEISNGAQPDVFWELFEGAVFMNPTYEQETSYVGT